MCTIKWSIRRHAPVGALYRFSSTLSVHPSVQNMSVSYQGATSHAGRQLDFEALWEACKSTDCDSHTKSEAPEPHTYVHSWIVRLVPNENVQELGVCDQGRLVTPLATPRTRHCH